MANWLHRLMNPHCVHCREDKECKSCDELRSLLNIEKREKQQLLDSILQRDKPQVTEPVEVKLEDIKPTHASWRVRQQLLENEDRAKAQAIKRAQAESISSLEKQTGIASG